MLNLGCCGSDGGWKGAIVQLGAVERGGATEADEAAALAAAAAAAAAAVSAEGTWVTVREGESPSCLTETLPSGGWIGQGCCSREMREEITEGGRGQWVMVRPAGAQGRRAPSWAPRDPSGLMVTLSLCLSILVGWWLRVGPGDTISLLRLDGMQACLFGSHQEKTQVD